MGRLLRAYKQHLLFSILIFLEVIAASPTTSPEAAKSSPLEARDELPNGQLNCETQRSSDYYGLGVRMGVYFTWVQAYIANVCVPSEIATAQDLNAVFLFAVLLSMVRCTISGLLLQMDGLMLMHIGGGTMFSVLSLWGYRTCTYDIEGPEKGIRKFGGVGTHMRLLLCMAISTYGLFFWWYGINGTLNWNTDPGCDVVYTFMFAKVRADGRIRTFYIFICIGCMIYFGSMLLASLVAVPTRLKRVLLAHRKPPVQARLTRSLFATGLNQKQLRYVFYFCRIGNFLFILYSMLLIEFSLNYNSVAGVLGENGHIFFPSQIIPTIIGACGFCRVIWIRYKQWKSESSEYNPPLHIGGSTSNRTLFKPKQSELVKIYTPKSNVYLQSAINRDDDEIDPLMEGLPLWLKMLVSWAPWLGTLRWWKPHHVSDDGNNKEKDPESPALSGDRGWSSDSTPRLEAFSHTDTLLSDETIASRRQLPQIPKNVSRFDTI